MPYYASDAIDQNAGLASTGDTMGATVVIAHWVRDGRQAEYEGMNKLTGLIASSSVHGTMIRFAAPQLSSRPATLVEIRSPDRAA